MRLEDYASEMETCCRCSACKFVPLEKVTGYDYAAVCPSISRYDFHAYSGGGRMGFGIGLIRGRIEYTPKVTEVVYNCNLCGACDVSCKYAMDMDVLEPLYAVRRECVERGHTLPVFDRLVEGMREGPMVLDPTPERVHWAEGLQVKDYLQDGASVIYHAGCRAGHVDRSSRVARLTLSLLQRAGVDVGVAKGGELCCGGRSYEMGYAAAAGEQAAANVNRFRRAGAAELVTACAQCYQFFKVLYEKLDLGTGMKVYHATEYLDRLIEDGRLKPTRAVDLTVTYHDPCHLGRLSEPWIKWKGEQRLRHMRVYDPPRIFRRGTYGVYDAPRRILRAVPGLRLVEMHRIREYAWCCGAGGGVREGNPEFALWTASQRLAEARSTGADALVTACPHCVENLEADGSTLPVLDVVEILEMAV